MYIVQIQLYTYDEMTEIYSLFVGSIETNVLRRLETTYIVLLYLRVRMFNLL